MCGIAGHYLAAGGTGDDGLPAMMDALAHRGPDGRAMSVNAGIGLGATRLSLLDDERGAQPMETGDVALVFNGEVYNHGELRRELQRVGTVFHGRSDTEVLLRGFGQWGASLFDRLEGMYAIAVRAGKVLHLARDPFGMKPLAYWLSPDARSLLFASEVKALLRCPRVRRRLDATGLVEHLVFGHTLGPRTLMCGVRQLAPGARMKVECRRGRLALTTSPAAPRPQPPQPRSVREATSRLADMLQQSVAARLHADHPISTYLSGGLDSTVVAALRPDRAGSRSFVVADGGRSTDLQHARRVATVLGLDHAEILVTRDPPLSWASDAVLAMEAPVSPTVALLSAPAVRRAGKAALCGEGSDELFAGYRVHEHPEFILNDFAGRLQRLREASIAKRALASTADRIAWLHRPRPAQRCRAVYDFLLCERMPNKHLVIWDRGAMAAALEIRMPFLDREIRDLASALPREWLSPRKRLVQTVASRVLPPALAALVSGRIKAAAPDALRATRQRLHERTAAAMPPAWLHRHPLRQISSSPLLLVLLDIFLLGFVEGDGRFPEAFSIETMYTRRGRALRSAHEAVREALFGRADSAGE